MHLKQPPSPNTSNAAFHVADHENVSKLMWRPDVDALASLYPDQNTKTARVIY